jgi:uncharacterized LabA/DUF88 family protein
MSRLVRIAVFYDGSYFQKVSGYYKFQHRAGRRLSLEGLHNFIRNEVAYIEDIDRSLCQIIEAHYFRGRYTVGDLEARAQEEGNPRLVLDHLRNERVFEQVLAANAITPHYSRIDPRFDKEKGVDVALALEAYDLAVAKRLDVVVLIASDGDFLPLLRKLASIGTRVILLYWEFEMEDGGTYVSKALVNEAAYPIAMHKVIDDPDPKFDIETLFWE